MTDLHTWNLTTPWTFVCKGCGTLVPSDDRVVPIFCPGSLAQPHVFVETPTGVCCDFCGQVTSAQVMPNEMIWECPR